MFGDWEMTVIASAGAAITISVAAFGIYTACGEVDSYGELKEKAKLIRESRPTAVNLMWAVDKMMEYTLKSLMANAAPTMAAMPGSARFQYADIQQGFTMQRVAILIQPLQIISQEILQPLSFKTRWNMIM